MKLIVFTMTGCQACAKLKPVIDAFERAHPEVPVRRVNLMDYEEWPDSVDPPETTPSFAVLRPGKKPRTLSGQTLVESLGRLPTLAELEKWILR
jgi:hypothetical protein